MSDLVERLREPILADAFQRGIITSGQLAERLITERRDAANEIERLRAARRVIVDAFSAAEEQTP